MGDVTLGQDLQKSFLKTVEGYYKNLADLLVNQGRLPEAQQVLAMLKEEEYYDFIRRDAGADNRATQAGYNAVEQQQLDAYQEAAQQLAALGAEMLQLEAVKPFQRSPEQKARIQQLRPRLDQAHQAFIQTLDAIQQAFAQLSVERQKELAQRQLDHDDRGLVKDLGHDVVLLHYLVMDDALHILVTTPRVLLARKVAIGAKDLNQAIQQARAALQQPRQDPKPELNALYRHLIQPVEADLKAAGARTLMLSLDGSLRYLPFAALHDGTNYLAERYALAIYTAAARDNLKDKPQNDWYLAGLGLSQKIEGFNPLPAVPDELNGIVKQNDQDPEGVLQGSIHLDQDFTLAALKESLAYPVIHLASHFVFKPGTEKDCFLLLGDSSQLDLGSFRTGDYRLGDVDLLTLSACETAVGGNGTGKEVEGFGALAQKKGAKGVLATLWPVADNSTGIFMQSLYRLRQENHLSKAEALRQAQLRFIRGSRQEQGETAQRGKKLVLAQGKTPQGTADPDKPYAHPYYWAPFILMGNWL
ncbi:MAG: CHAT domain-containing protein [Gammaproteobacteria bacterium]|nr:CHAT domain-containing protein [Gammaproteobacteria bacterium]MBU1653469.1 CHAT domain-containing protein [Gammaproteobacteria bacterium]MBU1962760.1 CHAT domain-containing protein [Gammaproteobacteria bacterium]